MPDTARVKENVLALLAKMKQPAHVAALSVAYRQRHGIAMKAEYKGGMLKFLKARIHRCMTECALSLLPPPTTILPPSIGVLLPSRPPRRPRRGATPDHL